MELTDLAAEISAKAFRDHAYEVSTKADGSVVTTADRHVESVLRDVLAQRRRADRIVGEEFGGNAAEDRCWYIDPIDGTRSFVDGVNRWSTLISLVEDGNVTVAVVDFPAQQRRFWATRGEGAFASGKRMRVSEVDHLGGATVCDDYRHHIERCISDHPLVRIAGHCGAIHPHEGHSMLAVSDGRADVGLGTGGGSWDYAPFVLLVEESGGRTSDLEGESRFDSGSLLASNGRLHDEVLRVLKEI
jgi:histidinol-phosphatase